MWVAYRVTQVTQKEKPRTITRTIISYSYGGAREELMKYLNKLIYKMYIPLKTENSTENELLNRLLNRLKLMSENILSRNVLVYLGIEVNAELRKNRAIGVVIERGYTPSYVIRFNYSLSKSEKTQYYNIAILSNVGNEFHYEYGNAYTVPLHNNNISTLSIYALEVMKKALNTAYHILQLSYLPSSTLQYLTNGYVSVRYSELPYFAFKRIEKLLM